MATPLPYATVEDVEARLGYTLDAEESASLEVFLMDFSLIIEATYLSKNKLPEDTDERILRLVTARRGAERMLTADLMPGQVSFTETVADRSISGSLSAGASNSNSLSLTRQELKLLGLGASSSIYSIEMLTDSRRRSRSGY